MKIVSGDVFHPRPPLLASAPVPSTKFRADQKIARGSIVMTKRRVKSVGDGARYGRVANTER